MIGNLLHNHLKRFHLAHVDLGTIKYQNHLNALIIQY